MSIEQITLGDSVIVEGAIHPVIAADAFGFSAGRRWFDWDCLSLDADRVLAEKVRA